MVPMDEATAALIDSLASRRVSLPSTAAAFKKVFDAHRLELAVFASDLGALKQALLRDGGTMFDKFCAGAHVRFSTTSSTVPSRAFLSYIGAFDISEMSWTGTIEDEIHAFVQTGLSGPIVKYFRNQFEVTRNNKVETSAGRADFSLSRQRKQVFRGEDKLLELSKTQDPAQELIAKSPQGEEWERFYGKTQYIFGYYCIGGPKTLELQFVCITPTDVVPLTAAPFNLGSFSGMLGCRLFSTALCPFLLELANQMEGVDVG